MKRFTHLTFILTVLLLLLAGCAGDEIDLDQLLPQQIGGFQRLGIPANDPDTGVDLATYQGTEGPLVLRVRWVGADNLDYALSEIPPGATEAGYNAGLGARQGTFFNYAGEYHAAWGNGDWVFVISTPSEPARTAFLAAYTY